MAQVTATTSSVGIISTAGDLSLKFGTSSSPGISFSQSTTIPSGFSGNTTWVQLADSLRRRQLNAGSWERWAGAGLDNTFPYNPSTSTNDSPSTPLTNDLLQKTVNDSYEMWLMFKPSGTGSIWVPLRKVSWNWSGAASRSGTTWTLNSSSNSVNPADPDSTSHPMWTRNVKDNAWVPGF